MDSLNKLEALEKLAELLKKGVLTQEEFEQHKAKILANDSNFIVQKKTQEKMSSQVSLELRGKRLGAGFIDLVFILLIGIIPTILAFNAGTAFDPIYILFLFSFVYFLTRDNLMNGGIGKKILKLKVVKNDGSPIKGNWKIAFLHNLVIAIFPPIEGILILATGETIGNSLAKTTVIEKG